MITLLNCSYRGEKSNSNYFLGLLENMISHDCTRKNLNQIKDISSFAQELEKSQALVLGMPLYVDSAPAQVVELLDGLYRESHGRFDGLKVYVLTNLGFYEGEQADMLLEIVKNFCHKAGLVYGGSVAVGAGEMLGSLRNVPVDKGPNKMLGEKLAILADHINKGASVENSVVKPSGFSRRLYMLAGNMSWAPNAKRNGVKKKDIRCKREFCSE